MSIPFGQWIKETRQARGEYVRQCAQRVTDAFPEEPMSRSAWSHQEKYRGKIVYPRTIERIAVGLQLPTEVVAQFAPKSVVDLNEHDYFLLTLGEKIACAREGKYTQEELGRMVGIGRSGIANYETGRSEPSASMLYKLCKALGVSGSYLIGYDPEVNIEEGVIGIATNPPSLSSEDAEVRIDRLEQTIGMLVRKIPRSVLDKWESED